jgi:hypothetical protein
MESNDLKNPMNPQGVTDFLSVESSPHFEEPVENPITGFRPHVNVCLWPNMPPECQDAVAASPHDVALLVSNHPSIEGMQNRANPRTICYYDVFHGPLPYFFPTQLRMDENQWIPHQTYFYAIRVDLVSRGGNIEAWGNHIGPNDAAEWRDWLFLQFPQKVRLAYVGPTLDCVYIVCQANYGGNYGFNLFRKSMQAEMMYTRSMICKQADNMGAEWSVQPVYACFLAHDVDVRWRGFIKSDS